MVWAVPLVDRSAARAGSTRVARIDCDNLNSGSSSFVFDEGSELGECPIPKACPLVASGRNPVANVRQLFQADRASGALRGLNERLRYHVVFVLLEASLLTGDLAQLALGGLGSFLFEFTDRLDG